MFNVHPFLVHFPLAILSVSLAFDVTGILRKRPDFLQAGWWCMLIGVCGLGLSLASGLYAETLVSLDGPAHEVLEQHEQSAFAVCTAIFIAFLWRVAKKRSIPDRYRGLFFLLYAGGVLLMWVGAWFGGVMVYDYGVGVGPLVQSVVSFSLAS